MAELVGSGEESSGRHGAGSCWYSLTELAGRPKHLVILDVDFNCVLASHLQATKLPLVDFSPCCSDVEVVELLLATTN